MNFWPFWFSQRHCDAKESNNMLCFHAVNPMFLIFRWGRVLELSRKSASSSFWAHLVPFGLYGRAVHDGATLKPGQMFSPRKTRSRSRSAKQKQPHPANSETTTPVDVFSPRKTRSEVGRTTAPGWTTAPGRMTAQAAAVFSPRKTRSRVGQTMALSAVFSP